MADNSIARGIIIIIIVVVVVVVVVKKQVTQKSLTCHKVDLMHIPVTKVTKYTQTWPGPIQKMRNM